MGGAAVAGDAADLDAELAGGGGDAQDLDAQDDIAAAEVFRVHLAGHDVDDADVAFDEVGIHDAVVGAEAKFVAKYVAANLPFDSEVGQERVRVLESELADADKDLVAFPEDLEQDAISTMAFHDEIDEDAPQAPATTDTVSLEDHSGGGGDGRANLNGCCLRPSVIGPILDTWWGEVKKGLTPFRSQVITEAPMSSFFDR